MTQVQVSIRRIQYEKAWSRVEEMQTEDVVFEGPIIAVNRGGAIVLVEVCLGCSWCEVPEYAGIDKACALLQGPACL